MATQTTGWKNRIIGEGDEVPDQLLANPLNFRIHPRSQQDALAGVLSTVGVVQRVIVNKRTGYVLDGHLRVALAISRNEPSIPVVYVDLSPQEEATVLATFDAIGAESGVDPDVLDQLLRAIDTSSAELQTFLSDLYAQDVAGRVTPSGAYSPLSSSVGGGPSDDDDSADGAGGGGGAPSSAHAGPGAATPGRGAPPSLDDLAAKYGEPDESTFWPRIDVRVPPTLHARYNALLERASGGGPTPHERLAVILGWAERGSASAAGVA